MAVNCGSILTLEKVGLKLWGGHISGVHYHSKLPPYFYDISPRRENVARK
jgi:hypothetical protein